MGCAALVVVVEDGRVGEEVRPAVAVEEDADALALAVCVGRVGRADLAVMRPAAGSPTTGDGPNRPANRAPPELPSPDFATIDA